MLVIYRFPFLRNLCDVPTSIGGDRDDNKEQEIPMMNLVDKYTADEATTNEDGVVAIEYVIVAAAIVVALGGIWQLFGDDLSLKLTEIVGEI